MVTKSPLMGWVSLAGFEVDEHCTEAVWALHDPALTYQFSEVEMSPPGKKWFRILVDNGSGERRNRRTVWALLWSLHQRAEAGHLPGYRVIHGHRVMIEDAPDEALPHDEPRERLARNGMGRDDSTDGILATSGG